MLACMGMHACYRTHCHHCINNTTYSAWREKAKTPDQKMWIKDG